MRWKLTVGIGLESGQLGSMDSSAVDYVMPKVWLLTFKK